MTEASSPETSLAGSATGVVRSMQHSLHELLVASEDALSAKAYDGAVEAMLLAVRLVPRDSALRLRLGLCLQYGGRQADAEREFQQAVLCDQGNESAYQCLVQSLVVRNALPEAIATTREMMRHCEPTEAMGQMLVTLLVRADRRPEALSLIAKINADATGLSVPNLRLEAELAYQGGQPGQAIRAAHAAHIAAPDDLDGLMFLAHMLCADGRLAMAVPVLTEVLALEPGHAEARSLLSTCLAETGNFREALQTGIPLVHDDPQTSRHWLFVANLASRLGYFDQAIALLRAGTRALPENADIWLALATILGGSGQIDEAINCLETAGRLDPANTHVRDTRLHYLAEREANPVLTLGRADPAIAPPRLTAQQREQWAVAHMPGYQGFLQSAAIKWRVITSLILRELSHKAARSKLGIASTVIEPLLQIVFLGVILSIFNHGRPPLGNHLFFFYATGVLPFYLFIHIINDNLDAYSNNQAVLQVPLIKFVDIVIATALSELLIGATTVVFIFSGFYMLGFAPQTDNITDAILAYFFTFLIASGISLVCAVLNNISRMVERIWQSAQRVLYIASGVFFLPQNMPEWVRDIMVWNPLLHCIEWFRVGFFPQYDPPWLNRGFLGASAFALFLFGAMLQSALRHRMGRI